MLPAGDRLPTSWVHYTTSCNTQSSAPEDGQNNCPKPASSWLSILFIFIIFFETCKTISIYSPTECHVFRIVTFLVRKISTFYINDVLLFKCPFPGPKG